MDRNAAISSNKTVLKVITHDIITVMAIRM